ncbi:serine hydrolase [Siphonobacter sp. SORGH_AS_1065]|uniref:serine hydrolase domain-containing protein n=1 Tax=Siphonobacter sp. SORGH_AS_1065 TaxID=3041795 RepID=UPI00278720D5|nr:serine hydrolase domain-containing protein [Siphonobacter sp. SORGH_AS_1065]MDQ1086610.1 CubicO group peptidase (beta-lactamase class C family) [Siphonobacter sp. SORGH_AS_1065]
MKQLNLTFLLLVTFCYSTIAQTKVELLDSLFTNLYNHGKFNGNVLVAEEGKPIFEKSYGKAEEQSGRLLTTESVFELASVSKQFTAMGIVLLQKQGKLKYDDLLSKYIPELHFYGPITIRHLLHHTAGLPDYMDVMDEHWDKTKIATNDDVIKTFARLQPKVVFAPNEKYEYSNTGYMLLGSIIERVSKKTYGVYLDKFIFKPLQMNHTLVYRSRFQPHKIENYALGYEQDSTGKKVLPDSYGKAYYSYFLDGIVGDGMVNSNLEDLLRWDQALYTDKLVNQTDKEQIFNGTTTLDGKKTTYGFGWMIKNSDKYGKIVNHSGSWAGYVTFIERHLDHQKTFIALQNNYMRRIKIPSAEVRKILYGEKVEIESYKPIQVTSQSLEKYEGVYTSADLPFKIKIYIKDGSLYGHAQAEKQRPFKLDAFENQVFLCEDANIKMIFNPESHTMDYTQGAKKLLFTKD